MATVATTHCFCPLYPRSKHRGKNISLKKAALHPLPRLRSVRLPSSNHAGSSSSSISIINANESTSGSNSLTASSSSSSLESSEGEIPSETEQQLEDDPQQNKKQKSQLKNRVVFGLGIGFCAGGIVMTGGWVFAAAMAVVVLAGSREFFELVRSRGIANGMPPPPRYVSRVCSVICALMPLLTLYYGHMDVSVTFAAFVIAIGVMVQRGNPRFAHLTSALFGLFYCGYLPSFWVKLRCALSAPALNTGIGNYWPVLIGGRAHWTVGLVATLISISSIIAADTFAFIGGRAFGKTPLINISPKKTLEGAFAGLLGCVAITVLLSKLFCWPNSLFSAIAFGVLNFVGSIFGDLVESLIKRDAGVKDSGSLIPGHGGILDRVDSYVFTGALCYSFVKVALPLCGV
ncbi:hypothetical protein LUZ60_009473 [Juncus effusus]|nr:hypothetical protein LUZ60_009473 [Juncus effusus]